MPRPHRLPWNATLLALCAGLAGGACGGTLYDAIGVPLVAPGGCNPETQHLCGDTCQNNTDPRFCGAACVPCDPAPAGGEAACKPTGAGGAFECGFTCLGDTHACGNACKANGDVTACGATCQVCPASPTHGANACDARSGAFRCEYDCDPGYFKVNGGCERPAAVTAGGSHTCAITSGGALLCWGANDVGQLGQAGPGGATPVVALDAGVTAAAAGARHTCAVQAGVVKCFGLNDRAQLGRGVGANSAVPLEVLGGLTGVTALAAGAHHTCALAGGAVRCWGANEAGQAGTGTTSVSVDQPGTAAIAAGATAIAAGGGTTCAATAAGGLLCWGANSAGQTGRGTFAAAASPAQVSGLPAGGALVALAVGGTHACAAFSGATDANQDGLWCWGANDFWQLGDGGTVTAGPSALPIQATRLDQGARVDGLATAGGAHTCAWRIGDASLKCGGRSDEEQVGVPVAPATRTDRLDVTPGGVPVALAAGGAHSCALVDLGLAGQELKCWGRNAEGQLGRPTSGGAPDGTAGLVPP